MSSAMNQHTYTQPLVSQELDNRNSSPTEASPMVEGHFTTYPPFHNDTETSTIVVNNQKEEDDDDDKRTLIDPDVLRDV